MIVINTILRCSLNKLLLIFLFVLCLSLISCSSSRQTPTTPPMDASGNISAEKLQDTSTIAVGDSIAFSVWGEPEFLTHANVRPSGTITIPLIGEIRAAGYTRKEFEAVLRKQLAEFIQGEIKLTLEITSPTPKITFLGAVGRQGGFPTREPISLLDAFSLAGGWNEQADLSNVIIIRQKVQGSTKKYLTVNVVDYFESGLSHELPYVYPGDFVFVPVKENFVRSVMEFLQNALVMFGFYGLAK